MSELFNPQDISAEKRSKSQGFFTESERINQDTINVLATKISTALGTKFEEKGLPFDIKAFRLHLNQAVEKVFLNPNIPYVAKEKFKQDLMGKIDLLAKVELSDINALKNRRIVESLWIELIELWNKSDTEKQAYFLDKILTETIGKYVDPVVYSLEQAFDAREKVGAWEYNQKWVQWLFKKINALDAAENTQVWSALTKMLPQGDIANPLDPGIRKRVLGTMISSFGTDKKEVQVLLRELQSNTFDSLVESYKKFWPIKPSSRPSIFGSNTPEAQALLTKMIPYIDAYDEFAGNEKDIRTVRTVALSNDSLGKAKEAIGMEQLKSEFDHLKPANIEEKMKKASFSDMVIMGTQLAQLAPIAGDIGGGFDGIVSALSGMNVQWAKLDALDRFMNGFFGILGITVIWGFAARAQKAGKMAEILGSLNLMRNYMPAKLEAFLKAGGRLWEEAKEGIKKFGKMMGKEFAMKIEQVMLRQWSMVGFVEEGNKDAKAWSILSYTERVKKAEGRSGILQDIVLKNASIPDTPEWFIQRLKVAENILKERWLLAQDVSLSEAQRKAILDGHLAGGKWVYMNEVPDLMKKVRASRELSIEQRRALIENGIMDPKLGPARPVIKYDKKKFESARRSGDFDTLRDQAEAARSEADSINKKLDSIRSFTGTSAQELADKEIAVMTAEWKSGIPRAIVHANAQLSMEKRLQKASELLGHELTTLQKETVQHLHNDVSKWVYQNGHAELRTMVEELDKAGFSREEGRKLMENGVLGDLMESVRLPKIHNMESILQETWLTETQFQQLFWMLWAKTQDIRFLDDGRLSIKMRDAVGEYYSIVFDPNLKTYKYISAERPPNMDFLMMQEYYARQIWCKNIEFRTPALVGSTESFDYLRDMFGLWFRFKDNAMNDKLLMDFWNYMKDDYWRIIDVSRGLSEILRSLDWSRWFTDFFRKIEHEKNYKYFQHDLEKVL